MLGIVKLHVGMHALPSWISSASDSISLAREQLITKKPNTNKKDRRTIFLLALMKIIKMLQVS